MDDDARRGLRDSEALARQVRRDVLGMCHKSRSSHVGSALSAVDLLAVLYGNVLRLDPSCLDWSGRDRFILSKGHAAAALYAVLAETCFFDKKWLGAYCQDGSPLGGHATHNVPGVEVSSGSLGHGLSLGAGMALAGRRDGKGFRVFVLMSDGECDEGSVWEVALFAPQHHLDNLVTIIDYNKLQALGKVREVLDLEPLADKWRAFRWAVKEIDGHDHLQIESALQHVPLEEGKPSLIIAHTVKGKGITFMEDKIEWHYKSPDEKELALALGELGER